MTAASAHPPVAAPPAPGRRRRLGGMPTLATTFDPRHNALNVLRLLLAGVVAVVHAMHNGFGHQPEIGSATLGDLAVDGFFVLSGFLVTMSWLRLASLRRYAWHRFLRIMPGFWVCLLLTGGVVAPLAAVLSGNGVGSVLEGPDSAFSYVTDNALLFMRQFGVEGVVDPVTGEPAVLDGSLWTLFYEAACYVAVAGLGVVAVLRRRPSLVLVLCAVLWVATVVSATGVDVGSTLMLRFSFIFMLGSAAYLFADRLPVNGLLALAGAVLVVLGLLLLPDYRALAGPAFAYVFVWGMVRLPLRQNPRWDLSYGLYVYHWPVQLLLALAGLTVVGTAAFVAISVALACVVAAGSWLPLRQNPRWDLSYGLYVYHWPVQLLLALAGLTVVGTTAFVLISVALACVVAAGSWLLVESRALRYKDAAWVERPLVRRPGRG